jgi:hypothetical protein
MKMSEKYKSVKKIQQEIFFIQGRIEFYATHFLLVEIFFYFLNHDIFSKAFFFQ